MTDDLEPTTGRDLHTDQRQAARLPTLNHEKPASIVAWDPRLAFDIAMQGVGKATEVFAKYGLDANAAIELLQNPVFQKQLKDYAAEIETAGLTYRMKARILAEDLLPHAYDLATDTLYPASVRADMIQWVTKIAGLEPEKISGKDVPQTGGFSLQILFNGREPVAVSGGPVGLDESSIGAGDVAGRRGVGGSGREPIVIDNP